MVQFRSVENMFLVCTYSFLYSRAAQGEDKETKNLFDNPFYARNLEHRHPFLNNLHYHHKLILIFSIIIFLLCKEEQLTEKIQLQSSY